MDDTIALHVVAPSGENQERIAGALADLTPTLHDSVESFRRQVGDERCAVVVDVGGGVERQQLLRMCEDVADRDLRWIVLLPERQDEGDGLTFRPVSTGFAIGVSELTSVLSQENEDGLPFELHEVLRFVARVRHDINNPLTAGMAETQLLLMDLDGKGEVGESLQTIERQLQRIQALVQELTRLRRPAPDGP